MWSPTHVKVTVQKARGLLIKGKNGVNDAFVTIALGKEKYQTSVQEKAPTNVEWHEECDLEIPKQGNTAEITLTAFHRNFLGVDEFLGTVSIPLAEFDVYERPRNRWYLLKGKPGKEKGKDKARGELEVKVGFHVKAGSLSDLSKKEKHKTSLGQLSHMAQSVGGSLLSIGSLEKKKGLKKLAKSLGKVGRGSKKGHEGSFGVPERRGQHIGDADPGVISEGESDDEFRFDELSHKSSGSSLNTQANHHTPMSGSMENLAGGEFLRRSASGHSSGPPVKPPRSLISTPTPQPQLQPPTDEWEQKLCGWKESSPTLDTLTRRAILHSQPEEEEEAVVPLPSPSPASAPASAPATPNVAATHAVAAVSVAAAAVARPASPLPGSPVLNPAQKFSSLFGSQQSIGSGSGGGDDDEKERTREKNNLKSKLKNLLGKDVKPHIPAPPDQLAERIIIGRERERAAPSSPEQKARLPVEVLNKFEGKSREDLIEMLLDLQRHHDSQAKRLGDLEDYLDQLLLRVMEATPGLLQNPFVSCKAQARYTFNS